jgi:hypothetical protein
MAIPTLREFLRVERSIFAYRWFGEPRPAPPKPPTRDYIRDPVTHEEVKAAAARIAQPGDRLSMTAVAAELGVSFRQVRGPISDLMIKQAWPYLAPIKCNTRYDPQRNGVEPCPAPPSS